MEEPGPLAVSLSNRELRSLLNMVVDSSLPGHSAAKVQRSLEYRVSLRPGERSPARLRVRYLHTEDQPDPVCRQAVAAAKGCYFNYFRIYLSPMARNVENTPVPIHPGAEKLIWGYPDPDSATVNTQVRLGGTNLTEVGGYITVEPGSTTTVPVRYELGPEVLRPTAENTYEYRLLVQKQPGIDSDRAAVAVDLPPGAQLLATSLPLVGRRGQMLFFDFTLATDTLLTVSFRTTS